VHLPIRFHIHKNMKYQDANNYQLQIFGNQLHSYLTRSHVFSIWISEILLLVIDYIKVVIDYSFQIQISNFLKKLLKTIVLLVIVDSSW